MHGDGAMGRRGDEPAFGASPHRPIAYLALLSLTAGTVGIALARDLLAQQDPAGAGAVEAIGYLLLGGVAAVAAWRTGLDASALGFGRDDLAARMTGGLLLGLVLALPALRFGLDGLAALRALPAAAAVALVEELLFRGVLLVLARPAFGAVGALWLTSVAFAAAHAALYPLPALLPGLLAGLLLGAWRLARGDLAAPIIGHAFADAVAAGAFAG